MGTATKPSRLHLGAPPRLFNRAKGWIVVGCFILLAVAVLLLRFSPKDPVFEGKPLSQHLRAIQVSGIALGGVQLSPGNRPRLRLPRLVVSQSDADATRAIRSVGTQAIPLLVSMLKSKDSELKRLWGELSRKLGERFPRLMKWLPASRVSAFGNHVCALAAFAELGPLAAPAIPHIRPLLKDPDLARVAIVALISITPDREEDILSLTNVLGVTVPDSRGSDPAMVHSMAVLALSSFGTKAVEAHPLLMDCLNSTNGRLQGSAAIALAQIGAPADDVVPRIVSRIVGGLSEVETNPPSIRAPLSPRSAPMGGKRNLSLAASDPGRAVLMNVAALGQFGTNAVAALPVLSKLRSHSDLDLRAAVEDAIARIENGPDRSTKAGR